MAGAAGLDIQAYLQRIGCSGDQAPTLMTLREIQWAHLQRVPFENLDIRPLHRSISLIPEAVYDKIVSRRRGGFCYELNGLLAIMLRGMGYRVAMVSASFIEPDGSTSPAFDHLSLLVDVPAQEGRWFIDVGAGSTSPARPIVLVDGRETTQAETGRDFRVLATARGWEMHSRATGAGALWHPDTTFTDEPRELRDFADRCRFQETAPDSHFTQGPLCSLNTMGGRITISGNRLIETKDAERIERDIAPEAFHDVLLSRFGVRLDVEE